MKQKILLAILIILIIGVSGIGIGRLFYPKQTVVENESQEDHDKVNEEVIDVEKEEVKDLEEEIPEEKNGVFKENAEIKDLTFDETPNVYLFWGDGCPYCEKELEFFEEIYGDYQESFNLYALEVWHNEENQALMQKVREELAVSSTGIPLLIINDVAITGFSENKKETILTSLQNINNEKDIIKEILEQE